MYTNIIEIKQDWYKHDPRIRTPGVCDIKQY